MKRFIVMLLLIVSLALVATPALAQQAQSLSEAVEKVRRSTGGKILSAKKVVRGDREYYSIKVITREGNVRTVRLSGPRSKRSKRNDNERDR